MARYGTYHQGIIARSASATPRRRASLHAAGTSAARFGHDWAMRFCQHAAISQQELAAVADTSFHVAVLRCDRRPAFSQVASPSAWPWAILMLKARASARHRHLSRHRQRVASIRPMPQPLACLSDFAFIYTLHGAGLNRRTSTRASINTFRPIRHRAIFGREWRDRRITAFNSKGVLVASYASI